MGALGSSQFWPRKSAGNEPCHLSRCMVGGHPCQVHLCPSPAFEMRKFLWLAVFLNFLHCPVLTVTLQSKYQYPSVMRQPKSVSTSPMAQGEVFLLWRKKMLESLWGESGGSLEEKQETKAAGKHKQSTRCLRCVFILRPHSCPLWHLYCFLPGDPAQASHLLSSGI